MLEPHVASVAYLRYVLETLGLTATALAKKAGVSSTTLTRPLYKSDHKFAISTSTIAKIAQATGVNPAPFFETSDIAVQHNAMMADSQARHVPNVNLSPRKNRPEMLIPVGVISTGDWRENDLLQPILYPPVLMTHSWYKHEDVFAVSVIDDKADRVAMPGETLICVRLAAAKELIKDSAIYIVQRLSQGGKLIELSACYSVRSGPAAALYPASTKLESEFRFFLPDMEQEWEGARVIGVVQYVVRDPVPSA